MTKLSISSESCSASSSLASNWASDLDLSNLHRYGTLHSSPAGTGTVSFIITASCIFHVDVVHGFSLEISLISRRFFPNVDLISLAIDLDNTCTSRLALNLRLRKKFTNRVRMSVLADVKPQHSTCCTKYDLVCWGQPHDSFTAVRHAAKTCWHFSPSKFQRLDP